MFGVRIYPDQFIARERSHLNLLSPAGIGRQLRGPEAAAPCLLHSHGVPYAADSGHNSTVPDALQKTGVVRTEKSRMLCHSRHGPGHIGALDGALCVVPGTVIGNAVIVQAHCQARIAEERVHIPARGPFHRDFSALFPGNVQHPVPGLNVLRGENPFIIVEKIAVIRSQGIGVQGVFH